MNIIGYHPGRDPSACLVRDGRVTAFVEEERLIRYKHAPNVFPIRSIDACLRHGGLTLADIDCFAYGYDAVRFGNGEMAAFYYAVERDYIHNGPHTYSGRFTDRLAAELGLAPRAHVDPITAEHEDLAFEAQRATEEAVLRLLRHFRETTGLRNVVLGGGVGQNVKLNARVRDSGLFDEVFVFPIPSDSGTPVGAALGVHQEITGSVPRGGLGHVYWGPSYTDDEIEAELRLCGVRYDKPAGIEERVAGLLAEGAIIGWFQGRMEAGQRALGARSILADPRSVDIRDRVNAAVKYREYWRPFCPSMTLEDAGRYVERPGPAPFMIMAFSATDEAARTIPGGVHVDGTVRIQTVEASANPRFHALIKAFEARTGIPVLLNTSFNVKGEPIVCSPRDALRTFWSTGLDALAIGSFLLTKPGSGPAE